MIRGPALLLFCLGLLVFGLACSRRNQLPPPPATEADPVSDTLHGVEVVDDYRWLEDQESSATRAFIEAQNRYTDRLLATREEEEAHQERMARLIKVDDVGIPTERAGRLFYERRDAEAEQATIYVRGGLEGEERALVDPLDFADDGSVAVSLAAISQDGSLVAYALREGGRDEVEVHFRRVDTGEDLPLVLPTARYLGVAIGHDEEEIVFTRFGESGPRVVRRPLDAGGEERVVFGEGYGPEKIIYALLGSAGRYVTIHVLEGSSGKRTELWIDDLRDAAPPQPVATEIDATFVGRVVGGRLLMQTTHEAPRGRMLVADPASPGQEGWTELIPEREEAVLEGFTAAGGRLLLRYLRDVKSEVVVHAAEGERLGELDLDGIGSVGAVSGRWEGEQAFFSFESFHIPTRIYAYDVSRATKRLWFATPVPIDEDAIQVQQVRIRSKDGTQVPLFVVHKKELAPKAGAPTLMTGYGGFRVSLTPRFSALGAAFVESGGVFVVANLRGGGEHGEAWHRAGMLDEKQNTFDDFIAAAEWLIERGYTTSEKLAIYGGSNGGLLVGAAMTQRPELFAAVVCAYPLLDMLRYHHFLVARFWVPEYGSADDPEDFETLYAYSPYHRVEEGVDYPATLLITGDGDTRVAPLHARKMAAELQAKSTLKRPVMLRYHTDQGHAGGTPTSQRIEDAAEILTFLDWQLAS